MVKHDPSVSRSKSGSSLNSGEFDSDPGSSEVRRIRSYVWASGADPIIIVRGALVLRAKITGHGPWTVAVLGPRCAVGIPCMIPQGAEAWAEPLTPSTVRRAPEVLRPTDPLMLSCWEGSLAAMAQRAREVGSGSVDARVSRLVLRLGRETGLSDARGVFVPLRVGRSLLAEIVNCRVETVVRVLTDLQRSGELVLQKEGVVIAAPGRLEERARQDA